MGKILDIPLLWNYNDLNFHYNGNTKEDASKCIAIIVVSKLTIRRLYVIADKNPNQTRFSGVSYV